MTDLTTSIGENESCIMLTVSGRQVNLLYPTPAMIDLGDIAHALSRIQRFAGHTTVPYSVAEHSMLVARIVAMTHPHYQLHALLHDATEAYIGDASRPLKNAMRMQGLRLRMMSDFDLTENALAAAIETKWDLNADGMEWRDIIKEADERAYLIEVPATLTAIHSEHSLWQWIRELPQFDPQMQLDLEAKISQWGQFSGMLRTTFSSAVVKAEAAWLNHLAMRKAGHVA